MVIRTAAEKVLATVEFITATKEGDYGPYRSVLFKRTDLEGDPAKVWRSMDPEDAEQFSKGQRVNLIPTTNKRGKPSWDIELLDQQTTTTPTPVAPTTDSTPQLTAGKKQAIAEYVSQQGDLLAYCWRVVEEKLAGKSEESHRCAASSLYIAAQRKFNL